MITKAFQLYDLAVEMGNHDLRLKSLHVIDEALKATGLSPLPNSINPRELETLRDQLELGVIEGGKA